MDKWNKLKRFIDELEPDVEKFYNKEFEDTGKRVTVGMQKLKVLAHEVRREILAIRRKNRAIKERNKW